MDFKYHNIRTYGPLHANLFVVNFISNSIDEDVLKFLESEVKSISIKRSKKGKYRLKIRFYLGLVGNEVRYNLVFNQLIGKDFSIKLSLRDTTGVVYTEMSFCSCKLRTCDLVESILSRKLEYDKHEFIDARLDFVSGECSTKINNSYV